MNMAVIGADEWNRYTSPKGQTAFGFFGTVQPAAMGLLSRADPDDRIFGIFRMYDAEDGRQGHLNWLTARYGAALEPVPVPHDNRGQMAIIAELLDQTWDHTYSFPPDPIRFDELPLDVLDSCDAIVLNPGIPYNFELSMLEALRAQCPHALLYLDVHALFHTMNTENRVIYARIGGWRHYLGCMDVVQVNVHEANWLVNERSEDTWDDDPHTLIPKLEAAGIRKPIVTNAADGAYYRCPHVEDICHVPAPKVDVIDSMGAGDTFGGAYVSAILKGMDDAQAIQWACTIASHSCTRFLIMEPKDLARMAGVNHDQ